MDSGAWWAHKIQNGILPELISEVCEKLKTCTHKVTACCQLSHLPSTLYGFPTCWHASALHTPIRNVIVQN